MDPETVARSRTGIICIAPITSNRNGGGASDGRDHSRYSGREANRWRRSEDGEELVRGFR